MNNQIYNQIAKKIEEAHYILLLTHKNPDPDTLGSALALSTYFKTKQKKHKVFNLDKNSLPKKLDFLSGYTKIVDALPKNYDLVIYLDCSEEYMIGVPIDNKVFTIVLDHHKTSKNNGDILLIDEESGSTGELVVEFFNQNNIKITKEMAQALYVSIYEDTVGFSTSRTKASTFNKISQLIDAGADPYEITNKLNRSDSLAKYRAIPKILDTLELHFEGDIATVYCEEVWFEESGASKNELDFISNMVLNIAIVKVVAYFRKADDHIRVSLRGKGDIDLSKLAQKFNGGGHKDAAGFTIEEENIDSAKGQFLSYLKNYTFG